MSPQLKLDNQISWEGRVPSLINGTPPLLLLRSHKYIKDLNLLLGAIQENIVKVKGAQRISKLTTKAFDIEALIGRGSDSVKKEKISFPLLSAGRNKRVSAEIVFNSWSSFQDRAERREEEREK